MVILTYTQQLEEIQAAITTVLAAQEAVYNGQRVKKADLEWLHKREKWLRPLAEREAAGGMRIRGATPI